MSMKKKFLALALAGMVAMPVVANASTNVVTGDDSVSRFGDVAVDGVVNATDGTAPAGQIQVELPTAMSFAIDARGQFTTAQNYEVTNKGADPVNVKVASFTETNPDGGITVQPNGTMSSNLQDYDRSNVELTLETPDGVQINLEHGTIDEDLFTSLGSKKTGTFNLRGLVGTKDDVSASTSNAGLGTGINEKFTLRFEIYK